MGSVFHIWRKRLWRRLFLYLFLPATLILLASRMGLIERYFLYFPEQHLVTTPSQFDLPYEEVYFGGRDGTRLHGWFVPGREPVTLLWFHGNAGNISHRLENIKLLNELVGVSIFILDYRGYGLSEGRPSEKGFYLDAEAALAHLNSRQEVDQGKIVYFGRSLGAAVAVELAVHQSPWALILESPFPSVPEMARRLYPFLPLWPLLRDRYDSLGKIARVHVPLLVLHGDRDEVIPFDAGRKLFDAALEPKEFYAIQGAGHNDTYIIGGRDYFVALERFLKDPGGAKNTGFAEEDPQG